MHRHQPRHRRRIGLCGITGRLVEKAKALKIGRAPTPTPYFGPVVDEKQMQTILE